MNPIQTLVGGSHLLRAMGLQMEHALHHAEQQVNYLSGVADGFLAFAGISPHALGQVISSGALPAPMFMPPPNAGHCPCAHQYAAPQQIDFGASAPGSNIFERFLNRRQGGRLERKLKRDPFYRQQLEMMLGGRILPDGRNDGRLTVQPFPTGYFPAGGSHNQAAFSALSMMDGLAQAAGAFTLGTGAGVAQSFLAGALQGVMDGLFGSGGGGYMPQLSGGYPGGPPPGRNGRYMPGTNGTGNAAGQSVSSVLNDPSLTMEDKIVLMLMIIMKNMDKEIEKQAEYINKIQQQQNEGGKGGKGGGGVGGVGGGGGEGGGKSSPSIDVETMKLKRLIDKRSQMFDMLRQIIDKYNETAKNIIQSMSR